MQRYFDLKRVKRVLSHGVPELHDERLDTVAGEVAALRREHL